MGTNGSIGDRQKKDKEKEREREGEREGEMERVAGSPNDQLKQP